MTRLIMITILLGSISCSGDMPVLGGSDAPSKNASSQNNSENVLGTDTGTATFTETSTGTATSTSTSSATSTESTTTTTTATATGTATGTNTSATCNNSMRFNIALTLDNSISLSATDLSRIQAAANAFTNNAAALIARLNVKINIAVLTFNGQSEVGKNGWIDVSTAVGFNKLLSDIEDATASRDGGNDFSNAVAAAASLFGSRPVGAVNERNSWVLLSDKDATGNDRDNALAALNSLVSRQKIRVHAIGLGRDAFSYLKGLALPKVGVVDPLYVGTFAAVANSSDLTPLFNQAFSQISSICP